MKFHEAYLLTNQILNAEDNVVGLDSFFSGAAKNLISVMIAHGEGDVNKAIEGISDFYVDDSFSENLLDESTSSLDEDCISVLKGIDALGQDFKISVCASALSLLH